jgi:hypothetical protein
MTELTVAGLDRGECARIARRVRALAHDTALEVNVRVTSDAIEVQRLGKLGACTLLANGRFLAQNPGDVELKRLLVTCVAQTPALEFGMTA